jgi:hypothetical protein
LAGPLTSKDFLDVNFVFCLSTVRRHVGRFCKRLPRSA